MGVVVMSLIVGVVLGAIVGAVLMAVLASRITDELGEIGNGEYISKR